ncbi:hypothetical protein [Streptacidiphilus neutrinimicus]|uniref:hypothetical protein n=1 Tax=Streptacidiphilus neutrinimicus TaxID=105420 RepID=UPI0005AAF019|nr:hypothetical protein [Streptacidiphilus neutrinimicus]
MTAQATKSLDEAFWDLVLSDPDLLDLAFHSLADPADPVGPGEMPPADDGPGDADGRDHPRPGSVDLAAPPALFGHGPRTTWGRVRSPPTTTCPERWEVIRGETPAG